MEIYITKSLKDLDVIIRSQVPRPDKAIHVMLNRTQLNILGYLMKHQKQDICQKDIVVETGLKKASITEALDILEEQGLVVRIPNKEDKRKNFIKLTEYSLEKKEEMMRHIHEVDNRIDEILTSKEKEEFIRLIHKITKGLKEDK